METIILPYLPKRFPPIKDFFSIFYWNGKKLFEIGHKEVFVIINTNTKKQGSLEKKRISIFDDPFLIDVEELFGVGMYTYFNIYRMFIQNKKQEKEMQKIDDYHQQIKQGISMCQNHTKIYYLNRQYSLESLLGLFQKKGIIVGQEIVLSNVQESIERIFEDVSTKDFLFFTGNKDWKTEVKLSNLGIEFIDKQCSFCEAEITFWKNQNSPKSITTENEEKVFIKYHPNFSPKIFKITGTNY